MTLLWIAVASIVGGVLSVVAAALVSFAARKEWIGSLVSFSVGTMLGAAFLELLPHAFEQGGDPKTLTAAVLGGILVFFVLEKLVIWRHHHHFENGAIGNRAASAEHGHAHGHSHAHGDHGRSGLLIVVGDSVHNFVDGVLIAAAFLESTPLGIVAATAVIAHEVPQEVSDFLVLLHSGYSRTRALVLNLVSSLAMLIGGVLAYFALSVLASWTNFLVVIAAASMIYIAVADLIPSLHRRPELRATGMQVLLIALGVATIWGVGLITHGH